MRKRHAGSTQAIIGSTLAALVLAFWSRPVAEAAGLLIADGGFGGALEIKEHDVKVAISNGIAVTEVEQVFLNKEQRIVEALYTFPVPKDASMAGFSMWIGGKEMVGEVIEKQRARQIYESYKQTRRDPGLLEQVDYKRFEMRIFPIAAGAEQRVRLTYYQELDFDDDWATYVYPLATVTRPGIDARARGKFALSLEVKSEVEIGEVQSPSHKDDFAIASHTPAFWQASLEAAGGDLSRDVVIAYRAERARTGIDLVASKSGGEDGYFLLTLTAGQELEGTQQGMDYVFVLDVSGSMAQDGKLGLSRQSLGAFVGALDGGDRFDILTFNVATNKLFGSLSKADGAAKDRARDFLDSQKARGGTFLEPALAAAFLYADAGRPLNAVILSDGMTEQRERETLGKWLVGRPAGCRVFAIGFSNEVDRDLLKRLAEETGGLAAFISPGDDFARQAKAFRRKLTRPAASNVKIRFDGGGVESIEPARLPDLYHGSPVRAYGRYTKGGPLTVTVEGDIQGKPLKQSLEIELPKGGDSHPEIERMWASHRIRRLLGEAKEGGAASPAAQEIVRLCEEFSITSEHASFIVLENDEEYRRWKIDRRNAARTQRDRKAQLALRTELDALRRRNIERVSAPGEAQRVAEVLGADGAGQDAAAAAAPGAAPPTSPAAPLARSPSSAGSTPARGRGWDLDIPLRGGGAIDPASALAAAALAALAIGAKRRGHRGTPKCPHS